jgi:hypothetical protein
MALATLQRESQATKPKNRRSRRQKPTGLPWLGRCHCDGCKGRPWPAVYMVAVDILDANVRWREVREPRRVVDRVDISYECFIESIAPADPVQRTGGLGTTHSASAASFLWLENQHYAGVNVDLRERDLAPDDEVRLEGEVARLESLRWYLYQAGVSTAQEENQRIQRYYDICDMHQGNDKRVYQWLRSEFPGWLV